MIRKEGSALLLTVMVISLLTTVALGGAAVRYQQFASTNLINNAALAESAAQSGVSYAKSKISQGTALEPILGYDLTKEREVGNLDKVEQFRINPRHSGFTIESESANLPRCMAAAVLNPWLSEGRYLFDESRENNPALIFSHLNTINATRLGSIEGNELLEGETKNQAISESANMGSFFNPFASVYDSQTSPSYWTIRLGGPDDQFLTKMAPDGESSAFRNLDVLYIPYLPRFVDGGLITQRKTANELRQLFEQTIRNNNFKVWLDSSVDEATLYRYGFADLFGESSQYRLKWLQPSLWNDLPEADLMGPYLSTNINSTSSPVNWSKVANGYNGDLSGSWDVDIFRATRPMAYLGTSGSQTFSPNAEVTLPLYGSLEGLRLKGRVSLKLIQKTDGDYWPIGLKNRNNDQGMIYNATILEISQSAPQVNLKLKLANNEYDTPKKADNSFATTQEVSIVALIADPYPSTANSLSNVTISANTLNFNVNACTTIVCPTVGDLIGVSKEGTRLWGKISSATLSGGSLTSLTVDSWRTGPKPIRDFGQTVINDNGVTKIAVFGGRIVSNFYDGGTNSELSELWFFNTQSNSWEFVSDKISGGSNAPSRRYGASISFDETNNRLIAYGGAYHEKSANCSELELDKCLRENTFDNRIKLVEADTQEVYLFSLDSMSRSWSVVKQANSTPDIRIQNGSSYRIRVITSLAQRSGYQGQLLNIKTGVSATSPLNLVSGSNTITTPTLPAGLAVGDKVFLSGYYSASNKLFRGWAVINSITYNYPPPMQPGSPTGTIIFTPIGISLNTTVSLNSLVIKPLHRSHQNMTCVGYSSGSSSYCQLAASAPIALGDLVVLENYDNINNPVQLNTALSGYVYKIEGSGANNNVYFKPTEPTAYVSAIGATDSALRYPAPSINCGSAIYDYDGAGGESPRLIVWQGSTASSNDAYSSQGVWQYNFTSNSWSSFITSYTNLNPFPPPVGTGFGLQVLKFPANKIVALENGLNNFAITKSNGQWSNTYQISFSSSENVSHLAVDAPIVLERQKYLAAGDSNEVFHARIISIDANQTKITIRHDDNFPSDNGITQNLDNVRLTVFYDQMSSTHVSNSITANNNSQIQQSIANNPLAKVPVGATVAVVRKSNNAGTIRLEAVHTAQIASRVINNNLIQLNAISRFADAPASQQGLSNHFTLHKAGATDYASVLTVDRYDNLVEGGDYEAFRYNPFEWIATNIKVSMQNPATALSWRVRVSSADANERPFSRAYSFSAVYIQNPSTAANTVFWQGGATYGPNATIWYNNKAGEPRAPFTAAWKKVEEPNSAQSDLPNLFGGGLSVFGDGSQAFYFGGKLRFDASMEDNNRLYGPRIMGPNENAPNDQMKDWDTSVPLANRILNGIYSQLPESSVVKESFKLDQHTNSSGVCKYIGQSNCQKQQIRHLGTLGRSASSYTGIKGNTNGLSYALIDRGSEVKYLFSAPQRHSQSSTVRRGQDGFYPTNSNKELGLVALIRSVDFGGSTLLVSAFSTIRSFDLLSYAQSSGYCGYYQAGNCQSPLGFNPDSEDVLFALNTSKALSQSDTYRIIGYYGSVKKAYLLTYRSGIFSIIPTSP